MCLQNALSICCTGAEFQDAVPVVRILVWILLVEFLNPFLSHALFAQGRQARSAFVAGISLVFNATATFLLVHKYGAAGAALATVLSGFVATIFYSAFFDDVGSARAGYADRGAGDGSFARYGHRVVLQSKR